jgi:hypothetical protein
VQLEGLSQLKNPITSGIEPMTFQLAAQCLNHATAYPSFQWHQGVISQGHEAGHSSPASAEVKQVCICFQVKLN